MGKVLEFKKKDLPTTDEEIELKLMWYLAHRGEMSYEEYKSRFGVVIIPDYKDFERSH